MIGIEPPVARKAVKGTIGLVAQLASRPVFRMVLYRIEA